MVAYDLVMQASLTMVRDDISNTLRPRQNGRHFAEDTFNHIFVNENIRISIKFSLKFVPKGPINNIPSLVHIMALCRPGDKPISEPEMFSLLTHICVTPPQWIKWKHFPCYWPFVSGTHWSLVDSPHKGQWCGALIFPLICAWINSRANNQDTGDFGCHCTHYDVTVIIFLVLPGYFDFGTARINSRVPLLAPFNYRN